MSFARTRDWSTSWRTGTLAQPPTSSTSSATETALSPQTFEHPRLQAGGEAVGADDVAHVGEVPGRVGVAGPQDALRAPLGLRRGDLARQGAQHVLLALAGPAWLKGRIWTIRIPWDAA